MAIILREHLGKHGPPVHHHHGVWAGSSICCDCYDGTEDSGWQPATYGDGKSRGEAFVNAAIAWNEFIEDEP